MGITGRGTPRRAALNMFWKKRSATAIDPPSPAALGRAAPGVSWSLMNSVTLSRRWLDTVL